MKRYLLLLPIILLSVVGVGFYSVTTVDIDTPKGVVGIVHPECIIDNGLFTRTYYMQYMVLPTENTKADAVYRVTVDNGSVMREDKVLWTKLERDIQETKTIEHKISQQEFTALSQQPQYETTITEVRSERDGNYLMWPVLYMGVLILVAMSGVSLIGKPRKKERITTRPFRNMALETVPIKLSDEDKAKRCFECTDLKMSNSILRCSLETCKYGV